MRNNFRGTVLFLTGLLMLLTACQTGDITDTGSENIDLPGWAQHADEPVILRWYINYAWFTTKWGHDIVSQKITEETGVEIEFVVPSGTESQYLDALIASNTLPDYVTMGWWENQTVEMIDGGQAYSLSELADQYDPYFNKVVRPETADWYRQPDGNLYCYPNSSLTKQDYETYSNISSVQTFLVRKDIYESIGSPDMTTQEGFIDAVRMAAQQYPEVDGKPLIPFGTHEFSKTGNDSLSGQLMNFLAIPQEKDGRFYDRYTDEEFYSWLKVFRQLCEEGYLPNEVFLDKRAQMEEKIREGRYFCMLYQRTDMVDQQKFLYNKNPDSIYIAVDGPRNSNGDPHTLPGSGINGWTVTFISRNCQRPDRAIQFMSYLISEHGQKRTYLGVEGETYEILDGKPVFKDAVKELLSYERAEFDNKYGCYYTYWMLQDLAVSSPWEQEEAEYLTQLLEWSYPYLYYSGIYETKFLNGSPEAIADHQVKLHWGETLPRLLHANDEIEFDRIWEAFCRGRSELGIELVLAESERQMNESKQKMGIE